MHETLLRSSLGSVDVGSPVNLERPLTLSTRLGGHLVQGHVDATTSVVSRTPGDAWEVVRLALPDALARYVVEKGSITVDGSLADRVSARCRMVRGQPDPHDARADHARQQAAG